MLVQMNNINLNHLNIKPENTLELNDHIKLSDYN